VPNSPLCCSAPGSPVGPASSREEHPRLPPQCALPAKFSLPGRGVHRSGNLECYSFPRLPPFCCLKSTSPGLLLEINATSLDKVPLSSPSAAVFSPERRRRTLAHVPPRKPLSEPPFPLISRRCDPDLPLFVFFFRHRRYEKVGFFLVLTSPLLRFLPLACVPSSDQTPPASLKKALGNRLFSRSLHSHLFVLDSLFTSEDVKGPFGTLAIVPLHRAPFSSRSRFLEETFRFLSHGTSSKVSFPRGAFYPDLSFHHPGCRDRFFPETSLQNRPPVH